MRKQELDNWVKSGGDLPQNLTDNEKSYLEGLGWECLEDWFENGVKRYVHHYLNRKNHGRHQDWFEDGNVYMDAYYSNGENHGKYEKWYWNGDKRVEFSYHYGKQHGVFKMWGQSRKLINHEEYAYGILLKDYLK